MPKSLLKWLRFHASWVYRIATWLVLFGGFAFSAIVFGVHYWLLPHIGEYRETIAQDLSAAAQQRVTIGRLTGYWEGLHLTLVLDDVTVYDKADRPALMLKHIENVLSWWSLVYLEPRLHSIEIEQPSLSIRRDHDGVISVAGIEIKAEGGGGFSDWLLRQDRIVIRNAKISWQDDVRAAPPLELENVDFRLDNSGGRHRFGLRAVAPRQLAAPLDVRGDLRGSTVTDPAQWSGELFARLDYVNIAAWRTWVPFPMAFPHGSGAARVWADFDRGQLIGITTDVELSQVKTRLAQDLPELNLNSLKGRLAWKALPDGFEFSTVQLGVATQNGLTLPAMDFLLRYQRDSRTQPERGELRANELQIDPLRSLADYLPFSADMRNEIAQYAPHGRLYDVAVKWNGSWPNPAHYSVKSKFSGLGLQPVGKLPGFAGLDGQVEGNEDGGTLYLDADNTQAALPLVFGDKLDFESLSARVVWEHSGDQYNIKLNNISFANADVAGNVYGTYRSSTTGRGSVDLSGNLTRADVRRVARYIPLQVGPSVRHWIDTAFLAGTADDVQLRLKGDLDRFPFSDGKSGIFRVAVKVAGVTLDYANGWPKIENIAGDLIFSGRQMDIAVREGHIFGTKLAPVRAQIPDLGVAHSTLSVDGTVEGPTSDFLAFVAQIPTLETAKYFTEKIKAEGSGRLKLKLVMPLDHSTSPRVAGDYQFINNRLTDDSGIPALEQVNGRLEFTEAGVRVPNITLSFLGGPASLSADKGADGATRISAHGHINMENFRSAALAPAWAQSLHGATDWTTVIALNNERQVNLVFESTLDGITSDLPAPLAKASPGRMLLKIEHDVLKAPRERFVFSLENVVSARLIGHEEDGHFAIERGSVNFGAGDGVAPPRRNGMGITLSGTIPSLDLGGWLTLLGSTGGGVTPPGLAGIDLRISALDIYGLPFHDLAIVGGRAQNGALHATVTSQEITGDLNWRWQPDGTHLQARLKQFTIPAARQTTADTTPTTATGKLEAKDLPTLDLSAENFVLRDKALGKLELAATPENNDWRIDKLRISNPDATLQINGRWENWLAASRTEANVHLEVGDIGKLLARIGQLQGIKHGTAQLSGTLSWDGAPYNIDYKTMSGNLVIDAKKGQFTKLNPGVSRLFGILSLQSLPQRLSFNFRDIFGAGLAFDEITGTVKVNRGLASTDNFRIQSPSSRITMNGDVDLSAETQKLHVKVYPNLSDSLSVVTTLVNPPIGIGLYLGQKLLKDPIGQMSAREYNITGSWSDPQVAKFVAQVPSAQSP